MICNKKKEWFAIPFFSSRCQIGYSRYLYQINSQFFRYIKGLAAGGNYKEMEQYIAKMDESMNLFELAVIGGINSNYQAGYGARRTTRNTSEKFDDAKSTLSKSHTEIIVKPDGSRVLVTTMNVGGMETTMSLEISKPTEASNDNPRQDTERNMPAAENDAGTDELSNVSNAISKM